MRAKSVAKGTSGAKWPSGGGLRHRGRHEHIEARHDVPVGTREASQPHGRGQPGEFGVCEELHEPRCPWVQLQSIEPEVEDQPPQPDPEPRNDGLVPHEVVDDRPGEGTRDLFHRVSEPRAKARGLSDRLLHFGVHHGAGG